MNKAAAPIGAAALFNAFRIGKALDYKTAVHNDLWTAVFLLKGYPQRQSINTEKFSTRTVIRRT